MSRPRRILGAIVAGLALLLTLSMWALSSPVGASPDEDFHLASAWCGAGEREGLCEVGDRPETRHVPDKTLSSVCFAFHPESTASCQGDDFLDEGFSLVDSKRLNTVGQYPTGFYFVSSLFTSDNVAVSTIVIRIVHSAIFTALIMLTWWFMPRRLKFTLSASVILTLVPLGLFIVASPNPSSWAFLSTAALFPALLGYLTTVGSQRVVLGVLSAVAALVGFSARGDSAAYSVVAIAAALVLAFEPSKRYLLRAIAPVALIVVAGIAFIAVGQTGNALDGWTDETPGSGGIMAIVNNFLALPSLWAGAFAQGWGLGWLDTGMPAIVSASALFCFAGTLFAALRDQGWRKLLALAGTSAAAVVIPLYILHTGNAPVGANVQPRYLLPLLTLILATALAPSIHSPRERALTAPHGPFRMSAVQIWVVVVLLAGAQGLALFFNTRRYTGPGVISGKTDWWWEAGPSPLAVCVIGALAFASLLCVWAIAHLRENTRWAEADQSPTLARPASPSRPADEAAEGQPDLQPSASTTHD